jgi:hypothetical protein
LLISNNCSAVTAFYLLEQLRQRIHIIKVDEAFSHGYDQAHAVLFGQSYLAYKLLLGLMQL